MIFMLVSAFTTLIVMGFLWYVLHIPMILMIEHLEDKYPLAYEPLVSEVVVNIIFMFLGIVMFAVLNYVYVNSQKPEPWERF